VISSVRFALALFAASLLPVAAPAVAQQPPSITVVDDARRKLNLAGRQRMLTQMMAKAACFAKLTADGGPHMQEQLSAQFVFDQTLADLRIGSPVSEVLPETDAEIVASLDRQGSLWKSYQTALTEGDLSTILKTSDALLTAANDTVTLIRRKRVKQAGLNPGMAVALDTAGRERLLIQRASRAFCAIAAGIDAEANRALLVQDLDEFDKVLTMLEKGDPASGLPEPPVLQIVDQIAAVRAAWMPVDTLMRKVAAGHRPTNDDILAVWIDNARALQEMNAIVELYQELAG
jgi:hypothetical protein